MVLSDLGELIDGNFGGDKVLASQGLEKRSQGGFLLCAQEDLPSMRLQPTAIGALQRQLRKQAVQSADGDFPALAARKFLAQDK